MRANTVKTIYLDYNATTPIAPAVQEAMLPFLAEHYGNPSSGHALGRAAAEAVAEARERVASLLGTTAEEIVFTGCGTEANNLAIKGVAFRDDADGPGHFVISAIEHPAIVAPMRFLERLGHEVTVVGCSSQGVVDPHEVEAAIRPNTRLVSIMHANNETGAIQPIRQIAEACRGRGVLCHTDAAQSTGKIPVRVGELGVDLLTVAGHKIYAPKGVGCLYVRRGVVLEPVLHGAAHESGMRAGTENVPYLVGLGTAAATAERNLSDAADHLAGLRDRLYARLSAGLPGHTVNSGQVERLPNTLSINFPGVIGQELLDRAGQICASTGAACHSGNVERSATLAAMNVPEDQARGTVRLSVGWFTEEENIDLAASLLLDAWERLTASD